MSYIKSMGNKLNSTSYSI